MKKKKIRGKNDFLPYILVAPMLFLVASFVLYPLVSNISTSLTNAKLTTVTSSFIGIDNYKRLFTIDKTIAAISRTIRWTLINLAGMSVLGFIAALLLNTNFKGKSIMRATILIPWVLPSVVTGYTWSLILSEDVGILSYILKNMQVIPKDFSFFQSAAPAFFAAILANTWRGYPFFALMLYAKLSTIPSDQIEAARLDGAAGIKMFRHITFPYVRPVYLTCLMLAFLWTFNAYDIIRVMTNGGPGEGTTTISLLISKEAFNYYNLGMASSMSVVSFLTMLIIVLSFLGISRFIKRRVIHD